MYLQVVLDLTFSLSSNELISVSKDGTVAFWDLNSGERNRVLDISTLGSSMRTKVLQSTNGTVQTNIDATFINMHETPNGVFTLAKTSAFTWQRLRPRPRLIPVRTELGLLIMLRVVTVDLDRDRHQCNFPLVLYTFYRYWSQYILVLGSVKEPLGLC